MYTAHGADLSLTHGSVVRVEMNVENVVTFAGTVYKWDKKDSHKLSLKSIPADIHEKVRDIFTSFLPSPDTPVVLGVDWSVAIVYWKSRKSFAIQMGIFAGMLFSGYLLSK